MKKLVLLLLVTLLLCPIYFGQLQAKDVERDLSEFISFEDKNEKELEQYLERQMQIFMGNIMIHQSLSFIEVNDPKTGEPLTGTIVLDQDDSFLTSFTKEVPELNKDFKFSLRIPFKNGKLHGNTILLINDIAKISNELLDNFALQEYKTKKGASLEILVPFVEGKVNGTVSSEIDNIDFLVKMAAKIMEEDVPVEIKHDVNSNFKVTVEVKDDKLNGKSSMSLSNVNGIVENMAGGKVEGLNSASKLTVQSSTKDNIPTAPVVITLNNGVAITNFVLTMFGEAPITSLKLSDMLTLTIPVNEEGANGKVTAKLGSKEIGSVMLENNEPVGKLIIRHPDGGIIIENDFDEPESSNGDSHYGQPSQDK